jgi:hypothetical protein
LVVSKRWLHALRHIIPTRLDREEIRAGALVARSLESALGVVKRVGDQISSFARQSRHAAGCGIGFALSSNSSADLFPSVCFDDVRKESFPET